MNLERVAVLHFYPPAPFHTSVPDPRRLSWRIPPGPPPTWEQRWASITADWWPPNGPHARKVPQPLNNWFLPRPQSRQVPAPLCLIAKDVLPRAALRAIEESLYPDEVTYIDEGMNYFEEAWY